MRKLTFKGSTNPKWYPNSIPTFEGHIGQFVQDGPLPQTHCHGIRKNIAYTLQHLEFLAQLDADMDLSAVVAGQNFKTFVIQGCAVLEAIFFYALVSTDKAAKTEWASQVKTVASEFKLNDKTYRAETEYFAKLDKPAIKEMVFETMCQRVENHKVLKLDNEFYRKLPYLRKLRNRVHIYSEDHTQVTDFGKFTRRDFETMKGILYSLLTSEHFPYRDEVDLAFLEPNQR